MASDSFVIYSCLDTSSKTLSQENVHGKLVVIAGHAEVHKNSHLGERPYKCQICLKACVDHSSMMRHARSHTGVKPFECHLCPKAFTRSDILKTHMRNHTVEKPNDCQASALANDLKSDSIGSCNIDKRHRCSVCSKAFARVSHLMRHLRSHTGEKPH
jgi:KRAB domain-containing zinc finger protein